MESFKMIKQLSAIPKSENLRETETKTSNLYEGLQILNDRDILVQAGMYSTVIGYQVLETRNIPDELFRAYEMQYPNLSEEFSLYDKYLEVLEKGDHSVMGLVNGIKGKFFEFHVQNNLSERYPDFDFSISEKANQAVWDITGVDSAGEQLFIQVKMMNPSQYNHLSKIMEDHPDVYFATSTEIREQIIKVKPELAKQFIQIDIDNYNFTENVKDGLETLKDNLGIDVPDEVFALAPYTTEIILGVRLILDIASVKRDFKQVKMTDKSRIAGVKVLILFSRFGINTILGIAGSAAGSAVAPGVGTAIGGVSGVIAGSIINKQIAPYIMDIAYYLLGINEEDMFYYKNFSKINNLSLDFRNNRVTLEAPEAI